MPARMRTSARDVSCRLFSLVISSSVIDCCIRLRTAFWSPFCWASRILACASASASKASSTSLALSIST